VNPIRRRRLGGNPYPNIAARFDGVANTYLGIADNAALSMGAGVRMSLAFWFNAESPATVGAIIGKGATSTAAPAAMEYTVAMVSSGPEFRVSDGTTAINMGTSLAPVTAGVWYFVLCRYDGANIKIKVNDVAENTLAFSTDIQDSTQPFRLGAKQDGGTNFQGKVDCAGLWKRALTDAEGTQLYKGGVGMAARDLSGSLLTTLIDYWDLDGSGQSRSGTNNLTPNGGVTYVTGKR
jgi:hypothetical protein